MQKNQGTKTVKWLIAVALSVIVTFLAFTGYASATFSSKVLPNTYLLGKNFSGYTQDEIKTYFNENPPFVSGTINFSLNEDTKTATPEELGIAIDIDKSIEKLLAQNKVYRTQIVTPRGLTSLIGQKINLKPTFAIDSEVFSTKLHELFADQEKDYVNASIQVEDGQVMVKQEEAGEEIDMQQAEDELAPFLPSGQIPVIQLQLVTVEALVKTQDLEPSKEFLAQQISGPIEFTNGYKTLASADLATIVSWLNQDALINKEIAINQDALDSWLNDNIVSKVAVAAQPKLVSAVNESEVLDSGQAGVTVDNALLAQEVTSIIENNPSSRAIKVPTTTVEPEVKKVSPGYTLGRYSGKYIEIDLSKQMLYQIEGETLVASHRVSTGKWSMPTPTGEYTINSKTERAYSSRYDLYMPYWMAFIGSSYGIHELPEWADGTKEGQSHLGTPVSHGCVRLGVGDAAEVYSWTPVGTPVIIH